MVGRDYVAVFKRRREGKTDYRKRRSIIQGKKPFLTIRTSNRYIYGQVMKASPGGDVTLCASSSRDLSKFGWNGSTRNIPSAYLTGYVLGLAAKKKETGLPVVYSGVARYVHGSRLAAFLSGAREAGLEIELDSEVAPSKERLKGQHIGEYAKKLNNEESARYKQLFSKLLANGLKPEEYPEHFDLVLSKVEGNRSS